MNKVIRDDSAIRALKRMDESAAIQWLQEHLQSCYAPLLTTPWILDVDVTVKPLYGHQEGARVGYNPHKPGHPSHTYHSYLMANTRLVLEVDVQPGDQSHASYSMPGLISLLKRLPDGGQPVFIRGDCDWGNDPVMSELEAMNRHYLFKLKRSKRTGQGIDRPGAWTGCLDSFKPGMGIERKQPATLWMEKCTAGGGGPAPTAERSPDRD